ncbi:quinon protein alcohol dehydrogenase-like superfamily [Mycena rosella]|uniref:Quinon protein alcohol dehydrogenase-like superfamily n=1 Tax=Mycena rosella TaxID=1033263 RepID=A0AAD7CT62_MYCRO|nr:quinon protein alcohol dehydrogenase-like superfamily [Mycena rosella]
MTDRGRSGLNKLDMEAHHAVLALECIKCMNTTLCQNLCGIDRGDCTGLIPADVLNNSIPAHLRYASIHWSTHLSMLPRNIVHPSLISELGHFADTHLLHWLECLSLLGELHLAGDCLEKAILSISVQTQSIMDEVRRLVPRIFTFAVIYPLELYYSALEWLPVESRIRQTYHTRKTRSVVVGLDKQWDNCEQVLHQHTICLSIALSPDGTYLVSSCRNEVWIWRARVGQIYRRLRHAAGALSVAFSPDGRYVGSGSEDRKVRIWNVSSGELRQELAGHSGPVWAVTFSPDGHSHRVRFTRPNNPHLEHRDWTDGVGNPGTRRAGILPFIFI